LRHKEGIFDHHFEEGRPRFSPVPVVREWTAGGVSTLSRFSSSPFLLAATLNHHFDQFDEEEKGVVEVLRKTLCVDNSVLSLDTIKELEEFMKISTRNLRQAKMELRRWEWSRSAWLA